MNALEELRTLSDSLAAHAAVSELHEISDPIKSLTDASLAVGRSFSGSWMGYHSRVYYLNFERPPPGAHFGKDWGLRDDWLGDGSRGNWREYDDNIVKEHVRSLAGDPDLRAARKAADAANTVFSTAKADMSSIFENEVSTGDDNFLKDLYRKLQELEPLSPFQIADGLHQKGKVLTHDLTAAQQGSQIPPHVAIRAQVQSIQHSFTICRDASSIAVKAAAHLERKSMRRTKHADDLEVRSFGDGSANSPTPQVLLEQLRGLLQTMPPLEGRGRYTREQHGWIGKAKAAMHEWDSTQSAPFNVATNGLLLNNNRRGNYGIVVSFFHDVIARLENALPQNSGQAFGPGAAYDFFKALNDLVSIAKTEILIIDPYLDAEVFDGYLHSLASGVSVRLLTAKCLDNVRIATAKHKTQFGSSIQVRSSNNIHDRVIFIDNTQCWVLGASIKDAGLKKPTYLAPISADVAADKYKQYESIWLTATPV